MTPDALDPVDTDVDIIIEDACVDPDDEPECVDNVRAEDPDELGDAAPGNEE